MHVCVCAAGCIRTSQVKGLFVSVCVCVCVCEQVRGSKSKPARVVR